MSPTERRLLAVIGAGALALRLTLAFVTESRPLFPAYYYTDASLIDRGAAQAYGDLREGRPYFYVGSLSQRLQVRLQTAVYQAVGVRPFTMKVLSALMGALGVAAFAALAAAATDVPAGILAAGLLALWPSNAFYTSQNFKEAPTNLLAYSSLALLLAVLSCGRTQRSRAALLAACAGAALVLCGFYRTYVMLTISASVVAAVLWEAAARRTVSAAAAACMTAALGASLLFKPASALAMTHWLNAPHAADPRLEPTLFPVTYETSNMRSYRPTSPVGLTHFRRIRQFADRTWADRNMGREIGTQIFPNEDFFTWFDVALFVPKAAFYVLFMPLPLLYPMGGKLGRYLAAGENVLLLGVALLGAYGAWKRPKTPARIALLTFFAIMTVGSSLLEFDLGSAGRHKLLYLPMLFPFAAEEVLRLLGRKEAA